MSYKTILTHARADAASCERAEFAMAVAGMFDAAVYGVAAETWRPIAMRSEYGHFSAAVVDVLEQQLLVRLEAARVAFGNLASKSGQTLLWTSVEDLPRDALANAAEAADLVVADRSEEADPIGRTVSAADLVVATGLPVLLMADELRTIHAESVVVAWKNTREARRAVSDALPFLRRAKETHLAQVVDGSDVTAVCADLDEAAGRLTRHGISVQTHALTACPDICDGLEALARSKEADLIVAGAYGHGRLRELVFGGVTQRFLNRGSTHLLLSR